MKVRVYAKSDNSKTNLIKFYSLTVRKSIDEICQSAEIHCPLSEFKKVQKHDKIFIKAVMDWNNEERAFCYILVDSIAATLNNNEKSMTIIGRSYARDLVDSVDTGMINGGTLVQLVQRVASKYNSSIKVEHYPTGQDPSPNIEFFDWENESVWQRLLNTAENNGYSIASNNIGNLYVWKKETYLANNANHKFIENENIISASLNMNASEQFNKYCVKGNYEDVEKIDSTCKTKRVFTINFSDEYISSQELKIRAESELKRRKSPELNIELKGWGLSDEIITKKKIENKNKIEVFFEPKHKVPVIIPSLNIDNVMIIKDATYTLNKDEFSSSLNLVDRSAL